MLQSPRPSRGASLLLAAVLLAVGLVSPAAAGRRLAQAMAQGPDSAVSPDGSPTAPATMSGPAQAPAAAPWQETGTASQYGSPELDFCFKLTNQAGQACTVESDTLSLVYPRSSEELPTPEQRSTIISNMKAAAQPSATCCQAILPFAGARCTCNAGYQQVLPIGGYDPNYFEGATSILSEACNVPFMSCQPDEMILLPANFTGSGTAG